MKPSKQRQQKPKQDTQRTYEITPPPHTSQLLASKSGVLADKGRLQAGNRGLHAPDTVCRPPHIGGKPAIPVCSDRKAFARLKNESGGLQTSDGGLQTGGFSPQERGGRMGVFPRTEPEVAELALILTEGLAAGTDDFPAPPVPAEELRARLDRFRSALTATVQTERLFREQHALKDAAYGDLVDGMKADLKYGEIAVRATPEKLAQIGWSTRRDRSNLDGPGEVRDFQVRAEGDTWALFEWKAPVDGGAVQAYRVERKEAAGPWEEVSTAVTTTQLVNNQPRGVELSYRVVAMNKAGNGKASATATLVL